MIRRVLLAGAAAVLLLAGCANDGPRNSAGVVTVAATTDAYSIRVGDCVGKIDSDATNKLPLLPCDQAHTWEAFASTQLTGDAFPTNSVIADQAEKYCLAAFETFVGISGEKSDYQLTYLQPTKESWTQAADREVVCLAGDPNGGVTGTLKGLQK